MSLLSGRAPNVPNIQLVGQNAAQKRVSAMVTVLWKLQDDRPVPVSFSPLPLASFLNAARIFCHVDPLALRDRICCRWFGLGPKQPPTTATTATTPTSQPINQSTKQPANNLHHHHKNQHHNHNQNLFSAHVLVIVSRVLLTRVIVQLSPPCHGSK